MQIFFVRYNLLSSTLKRKLNQLTCFFCVIWCLAALGARAQTSGFVNEGKVLGVQECLLVAEKKLEAGDKKESSRFLNQAATIHWEKKEYEKAIEIFERSAKLNTEITNWQGLNGIYSNLGMIYADIGKYDKSVSYFEKVVEYKYKGTDKVSLISSLINLSVSLNAQKRHSEAAKHLEKALEYAREMNDATQMRSCYGMLSETYEKAGDSENSIKYFNLYRSFHEMITRDKEIVFTSKLEESKLRNELLAAENKNKEFELLFKSQKLEQTQQVVTTFSTKNKELLAKATKQELIIELTKNEKTMADLTNAKKQAEAQAELTFANGLRNIFIVAFILLGILIGFIYRNYQRNKRTNAIMVKQYDEISQQQIKIIKQRDSLEVAFAEIKIKNEDITKSINYAKRIQSAVLTAPENLKKLHKDSFVLFLPRDTVSGDFYWFAPTPDNGFLVAAVDCTGHGVPGAFMSMIGHDMLTEIYNKGIYQPGRMLDELNARVHKALHHDQEEVSDGMDISILHVHQQSSKLTYAGAKNPLFYIEDGELKEIRANRTSIGSATMIASETCFNEHSIDIKHDSYFYIFSDGYKDQFDQNNAKRIMNKGFKTVLLSAPKHDSEAQRQFLYEYAQTWKGNTRQTDDVLVIGLKF